MTIREKQAKVYGMLQAVEILHGEGERISKSISMVSGDNYKEVADKIDELSRRFYALSNGLVRIIGEAQLLQATIGAEIPL